MTALNFLLTRAFARELEPGDEVLVTRLDHDANVAPWLELERRPRDRRPVRRRDDELGARLRRPRAEALAEDARRRVPRGRELRRHGTGRPPRRRARARRRARSPGSTPSTTARTGRSTSPPGAATSSICSPYKFFGPHMGMAFGREELLRSWRPYKVRPRPTSRSAAASSSARSSTSCSAGSSPRSTTSTRSAGTRSSPTSASSGSGSSTDCRRTSRSTAADDGGPRADLLLQRGRPERALGRRARSPTREIAVWWGNYYALETIRHLGLDEDDGAVRAGIVHYNTAEEVDRLLAALAELAREAPPARRPEVPRARVIDAALERGHELTLFNRGRPAPTSTRSSSESRRPRRRARRPARPRVGGRRRHLRLPPAPRSARAPSCSRRPRRALRLRLEHLGLRLVRRTWSTRTRRVAELSEPGSESIERDYGALKALCERRSRRRSPGGRRPSGPA